MESRQRCGISRLAEEAAIVNDEILTYTLHFHAFSLEFDVRVGRSIEETRAFQSGLPPEFVYVVADMWLRNQSGRYLVSSEFNTGNLSEFFGRLSTELQNPKGLSEELALITPSGLGAWFDDYWVKVDQEQVSEDDERNYDALMRFLVTVESGSCVAVYSRNGLPVIEVSTQTDTPHGPERAFDLFNPTTAQNVVELSESLGRLIRSRMRLQ